jgi:YHS domain-containing protein
MPTAVDPICKMDVDTASPPGGRSDHNGKAYYFCAPGCKVAFDKEPERYLAAPPETPSEGKGSFFRRLFRRAS